METIIIKNVDVELLKYQRDMMLELQLAVYPVKEKEIDGVVILLDQMLDNSSDNKDRDLMREFDKHFEQVDPKQMVTFIDLFRKGKLYAFDLRDGSDFLLDRVGEENVLSMINSGGFIFGTEKPAKKIKKNKSVSKNDEGRDFAATTTYIYTELMEDPIFFGSIDVAMDIAIKFINKFPTGTDWEKQKNDWETEIYNFYTNK